MEAKYWVRGLVFRDTDNGTVEATVTVYPVTTGGTLGENVSATGATKEEAEQNLDVKLKRRGFLSPS